jgi:IS4 transposase
MARVALKRAITPEWIDTVFEANRQQPYARELLFSTRVKLMSWVTLGLCPSLYAAARQAEDLPVSLAALYAKANHTELAVLRALVQGSTQRLAPVMGVMAHPATLAGWRVRIVDGNPPPASEKRLEALRDRQAAALPGHTLVVYDPDRAGSPTSWPARTRTVRNAP